MRFQNVDANLGSVHGGDDPTVLAPSSASPYGIPAGTLLVNTYRVERLLGGGGMGEVYLARHTGLGTRHAIKVIRPALALNRQVMDLFYREALVLRGVRHESVVSYEGFVRDGQGRDYLVMEYVEGPSLAERLLRQPLTPGETFTLRNRLAAGLAEAHRKGAVHRDISPDNIILPGNRIEAAKLIDFGLSKLTSSDQKTIIGSSFAGKCRYASPEQFGLFGGQVDPRSDIYSLGLTLAAAALGRPLDMGDSVHQALENRKHKPDLAELPSELRGWIAAMLEPDPAARPASFDALLQLWPTPTVPPSGVHTPQGPTLNAANRGRRAHERRSASIARTSLIAATLLTVSVGAAAVLYWILQPLPVPGPRESAQPSNLSNPETPTDIPPAHAAGQTELLSPLPPIQATIAAPNTDAAKLPEPGAGLTPTDQGPTRTEEVAELLRSGRLDDAFAAARSKIESGEAQPHLQTWELAEALQASGKSDHYFYLVSALATADFGPAAFALGALYDPLHLPEGSIGTSHPDAQMAIRWYRRASDLGVEAAIARIESLEAIESVLLSFDCGSLRATQTPDGALQVTGQVRNGGKAQLYDELRGVFSGKVGVTQVEQLPWPLCVVSSAVQTRMAAAPKNTIPGIELRQDRTRYRLGDSIEIRVRSLSDDKGRIALAHVDSLGDTLHILPYANEPDEVAPLGSLDVAPLMADKPIGRSLLIATWCPGPLYSEFPPEKQNYKEFLNSLSTALDAHGADCGTSYLILDILAR